MIAQIDVDIPPKIAAGLLTGALIRSGSVVRDRAGRIVIHLPEISVPELSEDAVAAAARMLTKRVVIAGLVTLAVVGTGAAVVAIVHKRKRARPECAKNCNDSLRAYLEAVHNQSLDAESVSRLIADLGAVEAYSVNGITVDFTAEQYETLVQVVIDYTRQLAQATSIDLDESPESTPTSTDAPVVDLRRYLEIQRRILNGAA